MTTLLRASLSGFYYCLLGHIFRLAHYPPGPKTLPIIGIVFNIPRDKEWEALTSEVKSTVRRFLIFILYGNACPKTTYIGIHVKQYVCPPQDDKHVSSESGIADLVLRSCQ